MATTVRSRTRRAPKYRRYSTGQAFVEIRGCRTYLAHRSGASLHRYAGEVVVGSEEGPQVALGEKLFDHLGDSLIALGAVLALAAGEDWAARTSDVCANRRGSQREPIPPR